MADDLKRLEEAIQKILTKRKDLRKRIASMAVARIGGRAIQDFMIDAGKDASGVRLDPPTNPEKLTIRTQTLARAVKGGPHSRKQIKVVEAITKFIFTILVPYAAIHEYGGDISMAITSQMRGFFWAMWFETGEEKWKWMAITKNTRIEITMPKRPYMAPAIKVELPEVQKRALHMVLAFIDGELPR